MFSGRSNRLTIIRRHLAIYFLPFPGRSAQKGRTARIARDWFKFKKRRKFFVRSHNETLPVVAVCISNEDRLSVGINRCDAAPTPTSFAEIVGDDFPVLHPDVERGSFPQTACLSFTVLSVWARRRVSGSVDHCGADRTSDRVGAARE
jgi:hypothetical protein